MIIRLVGKYKTSLVNGMDDLFFFAKISTISTARGLNTWLTTICSTGVISNTGSVPALTKAGTHAQECNVAVIVSVS